MSSHFRRKLARPRPEIPTVALPDIVFTLLIFLLATTVFSEPEGRVVTALPGAEAVERIEQKRLVSYVSIGPERLEGGRLGPNVIQVDDTVIEDISDIRNVMYRRLLEEPRLVVSLRVDEGVEAGLLYDVQQELREAGALRVSYAAVGEL